MTQKWISQAWIMLVCKYMLTHTHSHLILVVASHKPCNICGNCNFFFQSCVHAPLLIKMCLRAPLPPPGKKNLLLSFIHARAGGRPTHYTSCLSFSGGELEGWSCPLAGTAKQNQVYTHSLTRRSMHSLPHSITAFVAYWAWQQGLLAPYLVKPLILKLLSPWWCTALR